MTDAQKFIEVLDYFRIGYDLEVGSGVGSRIECGGIEARFDANGNRITAFKHAPAEYLGLLKLKGLR